MSITKESIEKSGCGLYSDIKQFPNGNWVCINRYIFTWAIIYDLNDWGFEDRWCYSSYDKAKAALDAWDGEGAPTGWHRHPASGRRYDEQGNMYVAI